MKAEDKKTRTVTIRLTEWDYEDIEEAAKEAGLTISEFIRDKSIPKYILI